MRSSSGEELREDIDLLMEGVTNLWLAVRRLDRRVAELEERGSEATQRQSVGEEGAAGK